MSIKEIIGFILLILTLIGLFILLIWSMKSTLRIENERKKKQIEFYNAFIKWCKYHIFESDDSDDVL